ncbi:MAG: hypothetical protein RJB66_1783 [Pseudomonadota bacterium]|jgi:hypothetical protein
MTLSEPQVRTLHFRFMAVVAMAVVFLVLSVSKAQSQPIDLFPASHLGMPVDPEKMNQVMEAYVEKVPSVIEESTRVIELFKGALVYAEEKYQELRQNANGRSDVADEMFLNDLKQRKIIFNDPNLGQAEFTDIDGSLVVRMIDKKGTAIIFIHSDYVQKDSVHLQRYISRQNSAAGKTGRNLIVVWHDDNRLQSVETHAKPSRWTLAHWKGYLTAVYKPATFDSFCFGIMSGLAQAALTATLGALQGGLTPHVAILAGSVFGFGSFIGTYSSTYRNIIFYSHSKISQIMKQSVVSYAFAYMVFSLNNIANGEANHVMSFSEYLGLLVNIFLSSSAKNEFSQWARVKDFGRLDLKEYAVKIPLINKAFHFTDRDINYQMKVQLTTQGIRTADLLGYQLNIPLADGGFYKLDLGKILLWVSAPVVYLSVKSWANKNHPEIAKEIGLDTPLKEIMNGFFKKVVDSFKVDPKKWEESLARSALSQQIQEADSSYLESMTRKLIENRPGEFETLPGVSYRSKRCQRALEGAASGA